MCSRGSKEAPARSSMLPFHMFMPNPQYLQQHQALAAAAAAAAVASAADTAGGGSGGGPPHSAHPPNYDLNRAALTAQHHLHLYEYQARLRSLGIPIGYPFQQAAGNFGGVFHAATAGMGANPGSLLAYLYGKQGARGAGGGVGQCLMGGSGGFPIIEEPKPSHSYIGIIAMAILSSKEKKLVLSDIYQWILDNYPYFRRRGPGWRNSIRHNLSLNDCFVKSGRSANGKGHYWAIHPANTEDFEKGDFRRRRAQRKVRKAMGLSVPDEEDSPSPSPTPPCAVNPGIQTWQSRMFGLAPPDAANRMQNFVGGPPEADDKSANDLGSAMQLRGRLEGMVALASPPVAKTSRKRLFDVESLLAPDENRSAAVLYRQSFLPPSQYVSSSAAAVAAVYRQAIGCIRRGDVDVISDEVICDDVISDTSKVRRCASLRSELESVDVMTSSDDVECDDEGEDYSEKNRVSDVTRRETRITLKDNSVHRFVDVKQDDKRSDESDVIGNDVRMTLKAAKALFATPCHRSTSIFDSDDQRIIKLQGASPISTPPEETPNFTADLTGSRNLSGDPSKENELRPDSSRSARHLGDELWKNAATIAGVEIRGSPWPLGAHSLSAGVGLSGMPRIGAEGSVGGPGAPQMLWNVRRRPQSRLVAPWSLQSRAGATSPPKGGCAGDLSDNGSGRNTPSDSRVSVLPAGVEEVGQNVMVVRNIKIETS